MRLYLVVKRVANGFAVCSQPGWINCDFVYVHIFILYTLLRDAVDIS